MSNKVWKKIEGTECHFVSNFGDVKSIDHFYFFTNKFGTKIKRFKKGKILNGRDNGYGYFSISIGRGYQEYIHRLVAKAFIPNKYNKFYINHKNGIKSDNRVSNLEWCTASENQKHSKNTGLCKLGENHPQSKLSNKQVSFIREKYIPRHKIFGVNAMSRHLRVAPATISKILNYKARKHN